MRDSLRTSISQFSSAGGRQQARAANVRAVEPAPDLPGAERGNLYMLIEVLGGGGHPAIYRRVLDAAQKAFYETEGSLTTALQRAVRSAHSELRRVNEALPDAPLRAGITCIALQGADATVAQVNPALALISHPRTVDQFPPEVEPDNTPMGGAERPDVQLIHTRVEPSTMILLAESRWLEQVQPRALAVAVALEDPVQAVDYLSQLAGDADLNALVIGISQGLPASRLESEAGSSAWQSVFPDLAPEMEPEPERLPAGHGRGLLGRLGRTGNGQQDAEAFGTRQPPTGAAGGLLGRLRRPGKPAAEPALPSTRRISLGDDDEEEDGGRWEPASLPRLAVPIQARPQRSAWPLVLALVVIPLLIAAVVFGMWWLRNRSQEAEFQKSLSGASADIASAQGLPDEAAARQRLASAKDFLDKARAVKPDDSRLAPVQAKYDENLDRVNHVTPLYGTVPLWDFTGEGHKMARVLVKGNSAYVMDLGLQQISRLVLSTLGDSAKLADPPLALQRKQQVKDSDQIVADLVNITWIEAVSNQRSRLLALDTSGALYSYDVTFGAARQPIGGREQWGSPPRLLSGYNGNLYLVDTKANQVWRYKPTEKGYEGAPDRYFADNVQVDLAGVQSITIDGSIWLLYSDGRLLKFFAGKHDAFELKGLPSPLNNPVAVVASAEGDQIYVADTGNGRIVEFSKKSGQFQRQLRPAQGDILRDMQDLYLDEASGSFYILTSNKLYKANLPRSAAGPSATVQPAATAQPAATPQK